MNVSGLISRYLERKASGTIMPGIQAAIATAIQKRIAHSFEPRPTDTRVHVSDIANGCGRAVWHRIHHGVRPSFDELARKKFEYGFRYEDTVHAALIAAGYEPTYDQRLDYGDVVGHPDFVIQTNAGNHRHLISVKTTMLFRNGGPPKAKTMDEIRAQQTQYIIQDAYYAKALGIQQYTVHVSDRGTGLDADYEFQTAAEWPLVQARYVAMMQAVKSATEPDADPPAWTRNAKGSSYLCRGCPVVSCKNNTNTNAQPA